MDLEKRYIYIYIFTYMYIHVIYAKIHFKYRLSYHYIVLEFIIPKIGIEVPTDEVDNWS